MSPSRLHPGHSARSSWRLSARTSLVLDGAVAALAAAALVVLVDGGGRLWLLDWSVSLRSWQRLALWAAVILVVRRLFGRGPSAPTRLRNLFLRHGWPDAFWTTLWTAGLGSRLAVLAVGAVAVAAIGPPPGHNTGRPPDYRVSELVARGELRLYPQIAAAGSSAGLQESKADALPFPAIAAVWRVGELTGRAPLVALVILLAAFLGALAYLYRLARCDLDEEAALLAVCFVCASPFAVFFSVPSFDSLLLLSWAGAFYHLRRGESPKAAAWGVLAGLTSPGGLMVAVPLAFLALAPHHHAEDEPRTVHARRGWSLLAAFTPVIGFALVFAHRTVAAGSPVRAFASIFPVPLGEPLRALVAGPAAELLVRGLVPALDLAPIDTLDVMCAALVAGLVWPVTRRFGAAYGSLLLVGLLPPLLIGQPASLARQSALLFPLSFWLAGLVKPEQRAATLAGSAIVQAAVACAFFSWRYTF